jgi:hypothetical protein
MITPEMQKRIRRAEFWFTLAGALLLLACLSSCSFRQEIPIGAEAKYGTLYVGYTPNLRAIFARPNPDLPDPATIGQK